MFISVRKETHLNMDQNLCMEAVEILQVVFTWFIFFSLFLVFTAWGDDRKQRTTLNPVLQTFLDF